ncbi:hypothetical protein BDN70DRAFT_504495 [Pholiota conissans]|uniref:Uncharacterized protein n=1 Tax=Pholiota conissans TaxID=109636 RepID=A0A9P6CTH9_9AGAR|nr:hypothetical protein BDN70DRAFT_504495 [Pholiota conissans]
MSQPGLQQTFVHISLTNYASDEQVEGKAFLYDHLSTAKERECARQEPGQQAFFATENFSQQHRNFLFSNFMTPTHAHFLRWDRAGVVVSQASNYKKVPGFICEFLWHFSHMSHEQRGGDMSLVVATKDDERIFKQASEAHIRTQLGAQF